jgi:anti-anti-sigma factor
MLTIEALSKTTVSLSGRFDASQVQRAEMVLNQITETCILDCTGLEYISSAGIGVILALYKRLDERGGTVKMTNVSALIRQVFHYAGLDKVFSIEGS